MELFELIAAIRYRLIDVEIIEANGETVYKGGVTEFLYSSDFKKKYNYDVSRFNCDGELLQIQLK